MKISRRQIQEIIREEIRKVKGGYKVYPKKPKRGKKRRKPLSKKPHRTYKAALRQLRAVERSKALAESLLQEAAEGYFDNSDLNNKIDLVLSDQYTNINSLNIAGFDKLIKEIAVVESADIVNGTIKHRNEMDGSIKGVFQLSPIALEDLRREKVVPSTKAYWFSKAKERGTQNPWELQPDADIYKYIMMQIVAACLYSLYLYYEVAGKPSLSTVDGRANFWSAYYNSVEDAKGTSEYYKKKLSDFDIKF